MYHTICPAIFIFIFKTILIQSNRSVHDYKVKLYRDLFADYQKEVGPWPNTTLAENGEELVTVQVGSDLYTIDSVVGDRF